VTRAEWLALGQWTVMVLSVAVGVGMAWPLPPSMLAEAECADYVTRQYEQADHPLHPFPNQMLPDVRESFDSCVERFMRATGGRVVDIAPLMPQRTPRLRHHPAPPTADRMASWRGGGAS